MVAILRRRQFNEREPSDDAILVERARVDRKAFEAIYLRYHDEIFLFCLGRLGTKERAQDATSKIFINVMEHVDGYREEGRFRSYLYTIARNVVFNEARLTRPGATFHDELELPDHRDSPEELAMHESELRALRAAIDQLPRDQRRAIKMRMDGLTGREIAVELDRSVDAVKMLQQRALDNLKTSLCAETQ